jgi:hypothetical protein
MFLGMIYPQQDLDFSDAVADARNFALTDDAGFAAIFQWSAPRVYECHIMGTKVARGTNAMQSGREMLAYMKTQGARLVWGRPSIYNRAAICFIRRMGLKSEGVGSDPFVGEVEYFVTEGL